MGAAARRGRSQRIQLGVLAAIATLSWALAVLLRIEPVRASLLGTPDPSGLVPTLPSDSPAGASALGPQPTAAASASGATADGGSTADAPSESASATPTASPEGAAGGSVRAPLNAVTQCVESLLAPGAFERGSPDVAFVCDERYPRQAVTRLQSQISLGQWGTEKATAAMQEWAALGWYELAALSLFRGYCCKSPATLLWTFRVACPIHKAMGRIEAAVARGDNRGVQLALSEYAVSASCLTKQGQGANFGQSEMPGPGVNALRKMLDRRKKGKPEL